MHNNENTSGTRKKQISMTLNRGNCTSNFIRCYELVIYSIRWLFDVSAPIKCKQHNLRTLSRVHRRTHRNTHTDKETRTRKKKYTLSQLCSRWDTEKYKFEEENTFIAFTRKNTSMIISNIKHGHVYVNECLSVCARTCTSI